MKYFDWDEEKNRWLMENCGISFDICIIAIEQGKVLAIEDNHPPYEHQKIFIVTIDDYAYEIPYVEDSEKYFLKTIYPSHEATKKYLKNENEKN